MRTKLILWVAVIATVSCGKKKEDDKTGTVTLNAAASSSALSLADQMLTSTGGVFRDVPLATTATGDGLQSLKMYFRSIQICQSLTSNGSGYSGTSGCANIYTNNSDEYLGTSAPTAEERTKFEASSEGKFYDVLSSTDRAKLNIGASVPVGSYNYGLVETHPWVKIKAKSNTLCTKAAGAAETGLTGQDGIVSYVTTVNSLTCGSGEAEEVLTYITNANTNFKFVSPVNVAEGDSILLDLAFNLAQEIRSTTGSNEGNLRSTDATNSFYVPMIRIGAAPRKAADKTIVESYIIGASTGKDQVRLQLYYNSADTTKAILGINATVLGTATSAESKANKAIYTSSVTQVGDVVTVKSWDGTDKITFTRGAAGTATFKCESAAPYALESCSGQTEVSFTYAAPTTADL